MPKPLRVGMVHPVSPKGVPPSYVAFFGWLRELGYVEGDTLAVAMRQFAVVNVAVGSKHKVAALQPAARG